MKKCLSWVKKYWYIPLLVLGAILAWIILRNGKHTPIEWTKRELEAIGAGQKAKEMEARYGTEAAKAKVKQEHQEALATLDEKKAVKAKELGDDPQKLAKFLVRAGADN